MEVENARLELRKFLKEITHFLETKGYSLSGYGSGTSIGNVQQEFRAQTKEIGFAIRIKAVKPISK